MIEFLLIRSTHDELRRGRGPDRRVLPGLPVPGRVLLSHEPARLVLKPVQSPRQDRPPFVPDYLLMMQKPDAQQPVENLPGELRSVPYVRNLQIRNQLEGLRPISAGVSQIGRASCRERV